MIVTIELVKDAQNHVFLERTSDMISLTTSYNRIMIGCQAPRQNMSLISLVDHYWLKKAQKIVFFFSRRVLSSGQVCVRSHTFDCWLLHTGNDNTIYTGDQ